MGFAPVELRSFGIARMKNNMQAAPASPKLVSMAEPVYLDGFSTTPLAPEARAAMLEAFEATGNPSSQHGAGQRAARVIEDARSDLAGLIGASPSEILFTSGATEADNLAILGVVRAAMAAGSPRRTLVVSAIEHKAVLEPAAALAAEGIRLVIAPVDRFGRLDLDDLRRLMSEDVILVSVMAANNETGVVQPIEEAAHIAHGQGALFHSDAAQAAGKIRVDVERIGADYLSISAHKMYGPMGVGALYVAAGAPRPLPLGYGGGQERGIRPGTEPVPLIAGFGSAAKLAAERMEADGQRSEGMIEQLLDGLASRQMRFSRITDENFVIPGSAAIAISGVDAEDLCLRLGREVMISTGSACTSGQLRRSHVLEAMGLSEGQAAEVVRLFCGRYTTAGDADRAAEKIASAAR